MLFVGRILASLAQRTWQVVLIRAGWSKNGFFYGPQMLRESVERGLFESRPAMLFGLFDAEGNLAKYEHLKREELVGKTVLNQVGFYRNVRWSESEQAVVGELVFPDGNEHADRIQRHLESLAKAGGLDSIGLSIDAHSIVGADRTVRSIQGIYSIDVVSFPAAGGRIGHRIAASFEDGGGQETKGMEWLKQLMAKYPRLCEGLSPSDGTKVVAKHLVRRMTESDEARAEMARFLNLDPEKAKGLKPVDLVDAAERLLESVKASDASPAPEATKADPPKETGKLFDLEAERKRLREATEETEKIVKRAKAERSRALLEAACLRRKLPEASTKRVLAALGDRVVESETDADVLAKAEQEYVDGLIATRRVAEGVNVETSAEKLSDVFVAWLSPRYRLTESGKAAMQNGRDLHMSLHRFFEARAGVDIRDFKRGDSARRRIKEAIDSTNFDAVYADDLNRALLAEYQGLDRYRVWEKIVRPRTVQDFKTYRSITLGYYGELPTVAKGAQYNTLTTPTDRQETIALAKKGGTEHILLEDLLNDDIGVYQAMISRLARAAQETRHTAVFEKIRIATQPTMSDGNALTAAGRSPANLLTAAFSADATGVTKFFLAVEQMMAQTGGSGKAKGAVPKFLVIPRALMGSYSFLAQQISGGVSKVDVETYARIAGMGLPEAIVDHGTSNTTDWFIIADPNEFPVIDFVTLGGQSEPRIYVADDQRFGNLFLKDQQDLVIKDWFGVAAVDWVGIQGNDV